MTQNTKKREKVRKLTRRRDVEFFGWLGETRRQGGQGFSGAENNLLAVFLVQSCLFHVCQ